MSNGVDSSQDYEDYLTQVFKTGTDMMLPRKAHNLGEHCFTSVMHLPYEFYHGDKPACADDPGPNCAPKHQDHWAAVGKNHDGRVDQQSFVSYFMSIGVGKGAAYSKYLHQVFQAGTDMMLPLAKTDLGEHCFTSLMKLPFEFYVGGAAACPDPIPPHSSAHKLTQHGRVDEHSFVDHFMQTRFADDVIANGKEADYQTYLRTLFKTGTDMMLPEVEHDLGEHCLSSIESLAIEFYK